MTVSPNVLQHKILSILCYNNFKVLGMSHYSVPWLHSWKPCEVSQHIQCDHQLQHYMSTRQKSTHMNLCMHKCMYHEALVWQNQIPTSSIVLLEGDLPENLCQCSLFGIKFLHWPCDSVSSNIKQQSWSTLALTVQQLNNLLKIHYKITLCTLHCTLVIMSQDDIIV